MRKLVTFLAIGLGLLFMSSFAHGEVQTKLNRAHRTKANVDTVIQKKGKWFRDKFSTVQTKGLATEETSECDRLDIEILDTNLIYKIRCGKHFSSGLIPLASEKGYSVYKNQNEVTVTKMSHYGQKVQTSNLDQSMIRIPYVEEVTFIKFLQDGTLTFYKENFSIDDFGRVVQKSFLQGYGLTNKPMSVGRNF